MSMTTELIKALRLYANMLSDKTSVIGENINSMGSKIVTEAADTIEGLSTKLHAANMERSSQYYHGGWIPCDERLPEDGKYVLLQSPLNTLSIGYYCEERRKFNDRVNCKWTDMVKYWRPLPEPYQNNEEVDHEQMGTSQ